MTMPNFVIIGAAKAGTTSLHRYLKQHPDIFMSQPKELRFFPFEGQKPDFRGPDDDITLATITTDLKDYQSHFEAGANYSARGEASPVYLSHPRSAERIHHHIPGAKIIAILRHPADRAFSQFLSRKRDQQEPLNFSDALAAEEQRAQLGWSHLWHYLRRGFYAAQLKPYFDLFSREQLKICLYEDYARDPVGLMQDLFRFLNVNDAFVPDTSVRHNDSTHPRLWRLNAFLTEPRKTKNFIKQMVPGELSRIGDRLRRVNLHKPVLSEAMRRHLTAIYREDILELQGMLKRDLSHWLK